MGANESEDSPEFFEQLVEISPVMVWHKQTASQLTLDYVSNNAETLFGYAAEDAAQNWFSYVHPDDKDTAVRAHEDAAHTGEGRVEVRFRRADANWRIVECSIRRLPGSDEIVGFTRDVTDEREAQHRLAQAQQLSVLGRISAGVVHDFNNMLAVIALNVDALRQRNPAPELTEITTAVAHAAGLIEGLLSFAANRRSDKPTMVGLSELIRALSPIFERLVPAGVELSVELADDLPPIIADPGEIERLVINLAINSCDAMDDGGRLRIATRPTETGAPGSAERVALIVEDTGHGIAPDLLPNIFEPFVTTKEQGSGLGLAVAHSVVSRLGGDITINSTVGAGTTVTVELPAADTAEEQTADQPAVSATPLAQILVVDDIPQLLAPVAALLQNAGYDVLTATSGEDALTVVTQTSNKVDLLLTDISIPDMQGTELARQLREQLPDLKVVYMSGFATSHQTDEAPLIPKPFFAEQLFDIIHRTLGD